VDARLPLFGLKGGQQVANLTRNDVPYVAKALVSCIRGFAGLKVIYARNRVAMIYISGLGIDLYIRSEDWLKIAPYLVNGDFNPLTTAVAITRGDPLLNPATVDIQDADLYRRVSGILTELFPTPYPTSKI
jgi:hypothetical protein